MKPVILVTGKKGQLGSELQQLASSFPAFDFVFADSSELDITDKAQVKEAFGRPGIKFCINAAAYTAVDKAETEKDAAMRVNAEAVGVLAEACHANGARLIHVSTDYVFDGNASSPYTTGHPVNPVNYYGLTKLKGEELAREKDTLSIIIRTSWVYSTFGNNFVKTMVRLMSERESINVVSDQVGSPTYAADLASAIMHVVAFLNDHPQTPGNTYHYSNTGVISWYEFAVAIKELAGLDCKINPIPTTAYPTPAKRPAYSVMDTSAITNDFGISLKPWKKSLEEYFNKLNK